MSFKLKFVKTLKFDAVDYIHLRKKIDFMNE